MVRLISLISGSLLNKNLDLRIRLFNVLAMAGVAVSLVSAIVSVAMGEKLQNTIVYLTFALLAAALLWYSIKSGRYQLCYMITIAAIFFIGFPIFFFSNGGYYGSTPYFLSLPLFLLPLCWKEKERLSLQPVNCCFISDFAYMPIGFLIRVHITAAAGLL